MIDQLIKKINYQDCKCQDIRTHIPKSLEHYFVPGTETGSNLIEKLCCKISYFVRTTSIDYDCLKKYGEITISSEYENNIICTISYKPPFSPLEDMIINYNPTPISGTFTLI